MNTIIERMPDTRRHTRRRRRKTLYWPRKYYHGLTPEQAEERRKEIAKYGSMNWTDPRAYRGFKTNVGVKTRKSKYTRSWNSLFPHAKSLEERAEASGVPLRYIRESYNRGLAAWRTGHRPGATPQQWGYARVSSFLLCGKTHYSTDSDLVRAAKKESSTARAWWKHVCNTHSQ